MTDERIKEYVQNGGDLFRVKNIDVYRDGGTIAIETYGEKPNYYISQSKKLHKGDYKKEETIVANVLEKEFLYLQIQIYQSLLLALP